MVKTAVVLAAGLGARLNHETEEIPKGFLKINNEVLIKRSINIMLRHNIEKIIIGTGYLSHFYEQLSEEYPNITTKKSNIYGDTRSFYTLYNMRDIINEDFLLLESDLLYEEKAIDHLQMCKERDIILASGKTNSQDEVFIETDENMMLVNMSKNKDELKKIDGELVGISKISLATFKKVCFFHQENATLIKNIDYEIALTNYSRINAIKVDKIDDLVWTEIDNQEHFNRAINVIYPKLMEKGKEYAPLERARF